MNHLQDAVTISLMILLVAVLRKTLLSKVKKVTFLWLWYVVTIRLLLPFDIPSPISLANFLSLFSEAPVNRGQWFYADMKAIGYVANNVISVERVDPNPMLPIVRMIGVLVLLGLFSMVQWKLFVRRKDLIPLEKDEVEFLCEENPIYRSARLYYDVSRTSPCTVGLFRPIIVLPTKYIHLPEEKRNLLILHEAIHIKRLDALFKLLLFIAVTLHWYNPFVWLMWSLATRDIEIACDEEVMDKQTEKKKRTYAELLVEFAAPPAPIFELENAFSYRAIKERLRAIMTYKKLGRFAVSLSVLLVVSVTSVFATSPPYRVSQQEEMVMISTKCIADMSIGTIPVMEKQTFRGYAGSHVIPFAETTIYTNNEGGWKLDAGNRITLEFLIEDISPQGCAMDVGYIDATTTEGRHSLYVNYIKNGIRVTFLAPEKSNYRFYLFNASSDSVTIKELRIVES